VTRYRLSSEAQSDLANIRQYLVGEGGARLGRYVLGEIRDGFQFLAANPGAGHSREDLTAEPMKFWTVFSYLIVYDPATNPIGIARVLHGSQDLEAMFKARPPRA
jgi:plasmid stabilization system protein ParE